MCHLCHVIHVAFVEVQFCFVILLESVNRYMPSICRFLTFALFNIFYLF